MKRYSFFIACILCGSLWQFYSCVKDTDTEKNMPRIELVSPLPCDTLYYGQDFRCSFKLSSTSAIGNISMDMHNNFGHHSHGNHESCSMDPVKTPINPYTADWIFELNTNKKEYLFDTILSFNSLLHDSILYDTGDYHFHIYVTNQEGYMSFTSLDFKVLYK